MERPAGRRGENTLKVLLGHGWYDVRSVAVWNFDNAPWRDFPRMIAQLELVYTDGTRETVVSDGWFQTDRFVCDGSRDPGYEPRFTYNGFQCVEIHGLAKAPTAETIAACVIHTDFREAGSFTCGQPLLNKLQDAALWAYRGNFVNGYPTDCPHREKNGWTGDAMLASELAMYNFHNTAAYNKWVGDILDEQGADGNFAAIIPTSGWGYAWGNGPAWDSALVVIPWMLYVDQGDLRVLETAYPAMARYVDYMTSRKTAEGLLTHGLGDWIPVKSKTPVEVTSTGYYYLDAQIVRKWRSSGSS
ncbi:MAG: family 78 glycoside hydrolase catalytic domain [Kiritimatiellia bacterium]|nr:family 78 glycoside hydrolase catalytic domain [Kiritimatiellia bacterium]